MKKLTNFIVDQRYFILAVFLILTIISAGLSSHVKINHDISKYLPTTSETRVGMDIMESEFPENSTLNIMFTNLQEEEKSKISQELENIAGVKEVQYDSSSTYNKENATLYVISIEEKADSQLAKDILEEITEKYQEYTLATSGDISDANKNVLPIWIVALAVICALIILLVMCESYTEPFLFLTTILMAVVLNKGTNILFPNVSHITDSISAILQMALSMDYSIMLMNRYDQEKQKEKDQKKAMKNALATSFQSISSSSVTTIVGLLSLVFMSFKIGKDLGFILAKGVLFSLLCIFFVLPALILIFDKWIEKTKKKTPHFHLEKIGKISYHFRWIALPLLIIIFLGSFLLKGDLGILYTENESDEISKVFTENNQIAIIYKNNEEEQVATKLNDLENIPKVKEVLGYSNTINQKLTYDKLKERLKEYNSNSQIEDYLLKIIYYDYFNDQDKNALTFAEFVDFIEQEAYQNPEINKKIDETTKKDITRLKNFITPTAMNQKRTKEELAEILQIDQNQIDNLLIYYLSTQKNQEVSLNEFLTFINQEVIPNKEYASKISTGAKENLNKLSIFTNKEIIEKKMLRTEMAKTFSLDESLVEEIYEYYLLKGDIKETMTLNEFANFVIKNILPKEEYASLLDDKTKESIQYLSTFSDETQINKARNAKELASLLNIEEQQVNQVFLGKYIDEENKDTYSLAELSINIKLIKEKTPYLKELDSSKLNALPKEMLQDPTKYSKEEMAKILNIDSTLLNQIYNLSKWLSGNTEDWNMSVKEWIQFALTNEDIKKNMTAEEQQQITLAAKIINLSISKTKYSYKELSTQLEMDETKVKSIYALYVSNQNQTALTPVEFTEFLLNNMNDPVIKTNMQENTLKELKIVNQVMDFTKKNKKWNAEELANLLDINPNDLRLLLGLYTWNQNGKNMQISFKEFINFILKDVVTNETYSKNFDNQKITKLNTIHQIMENCMQNTQYNADEIFAILSKLSNEVEKNTIDVLYTYYGSDKTYNQTWQMTLEEFINYVHDVILESPKYHDFLEDELKTDIIDAKAQIRDAKNLLIGKEYSRIILNTEFPKEGEETFQAIQNMKDLLRQENKEIYIIGDSPMAYEISQTFDKELNEMTIITMIAIFLVVAFTFKSIILPTILVLIIQCAVYLTMGILSVTGESVYFISILIVQSILMGATIDYAILYTSYYLEHRKTMEIKEAIINSYNKSIHTILTSSLILILVTLIIAIFASAIAAKICKTISEGTIYSTILILVFLPAILALLDRFITRPKKIKLSK